MTDEVTEQLGFKQVLQEDVDSVEKFVFFVGSEYSGTGIIASLLDAHPNVVIADKHLLFKDCMGSHLEKESVLHHKLGLYNALYKSSYFSRQCGSRSSMEVSINGSLNQQKRFLHQQVIGDLSSQALSKLIQTPSGRKCFNEILSKFDVPVVLIHVVRNPYDIIATNILHAMSTQPGMKLSVPAGKKIDPRKDLVMSEAQKMFRHAADEYVLLKSSQEASFEVQKINIEDYIMDPEKTAKRICDALKLTVCTQEFITQFRKTAFTSVASDRHLIEWNADSLQHLESNIAKIPTFNGYSFDNDFLAP